MRILVVDDSLTFRNTLGDRLREAGFEVVLAESGAHALESLASRPDAIVLDLEMPGLSGIDTCKQIRQSVGAATLPILMLTARDDLPARMMGRAAGANEFLVKGTNFPAVAAHVVDFVRRSVRRRQQPSLTDEGTLLARVVAASGLAAIIAETAILRACQRAGIEARTMSLADLQAALPDIERSLGTFLAPADRDLRLEAVRAIAGRGARKAGADDE
jgi:DNA-binding response OmpR family regulator